MKTPTKAKSQMPKTGARDAKAEHPPEILAEPGLNAEPKTEIYPPRSNLLTRTVTVSVPAALASVALFVLLAGAVVVLILNSGKPRVYLAPLAPYAGFLRTDYITQGSWKTVYGVSGYAIANNPPKFPPYAAIQVPGAASTGVWVEQTVDIRGVQTPHGLHRTAPVWADRGYFEIEVNLRDDMPHRLALYVLDWDSGGRVEQIDVLDGVNRRVLDTRRVSGFDEGQYLLWKVTGHVILRITRVEGAAAVATGVFLD